MYLLAGGGAYLELLQLPEQHLDIIDIQVGNATRADVRDDVAVDGVPSQAIGVGSPLSVC
ncbi:MAG TPA: hypothetical protein VGG51_14530 [Candidatus Cybelea sp.]